MVKRNLTATRQLSKIVPAKDSRLTVIGEGRTSRHVLCRCVCGVEKHVQNHQVTGGGTKSCGCLRKELSFTSGRVTHGHTIGRNLSPEYRAWSGILTRCTNSHDHSYPRYGGRGIKVCERWANSFQAFFDDVGPKPTPRHSIDRIDNDGDYEPGNCRWATQHEQARNKSDNRVLTAFGRAMCLSEWVAESGISGRSITRRIDAGWTVEDALSKPFAKREGLCGESNPQAKLTDDQVDAIRSLRAEGKTLLAIANQFGVRESTISRIVNGKKRARRAAERGKVCGCEAEKISAGGV